MNILRSKPPPDQRQDHSEEVVSFAPWPKNLCNWPPVTSTTRRWKVEGDEIVQELHRDRHGHPRLVLHQPSLSKRGRKRRPRSLSVGDIEVLLFLTAWGLLAQNNPIFEQAWNETSESIRAVNESRLDSKFRIGDTQTDRVRGNATSEDVADAMRIHRDRFGRSKTAPEQLQYSERTVGADGFAEAYDRHSRRRKDDAEIEFRSLSFILTAMGRDTSRASRRRLKKCLQLWRRLIIEHRHWNRDGEIRRKMIGPIITALEVPKKGPIQIRICRRWLKLLREGFIKIKLPLNVMGHSGAEFNLRNLLRCWLRRKDSRFHSWPLPRLYDLIGIPEGPDWRRREYLQALITRLTSRKRFAYELTIKDGDLKVRLRESRKERRQRLEDQREEREMEAKTKPGRFDGWQDRQRLTNDEMTKLRAEIYAE